MYRHDEFLLIHHLKQSTNPIDKVFALIGISEARDEPDDRDFFLDYSRSLRKTFTNFVEYLLFSNSSLNLICFATVSTSIPNLPLWVPDWTSTGI